MNKKFRFLSMFFVVFMAVQLSANAQQALEVGTKAPDFKGTDQSGKVISLAKLLTNGDVVVLFYRGYWCPYCNKQLSQLNDSLAFITNKGASVIAIAPETAENVQKTIGKTKVNFSVLSDAGMEIMKSYKVNFAVDEKTVERYKGYGIDFNQVNGNNGANLPVPATYIIGKDGKIKYAFYNPDYRKRTSVQELINHLQ